MDATGFVQNLNSQLLCSGEFRVPICDSILHLVLEFMLLVLRAGPWTCEFTVSAPLFCLCV